MLGLNDGINEERVLRQRFSKTVKDGFWGSSGDFYFEKDMIRCGTSTQGHCLQLMN